MNTVHLRTTPLLDYAHPAIERLISERGWMRLEPTARIGAIYAFVRDEIPFGYNETDDLPASRVLADGYGQCNTKTTLLLALLRGCGIPCRFHGATIHKRLQKGVVNGVFYAMAPDDIVHSWAEVRVGERWIALEGVILDLAYLEGLRTTLPNAPTRFLGFGVGTDDLRNPRIEWTGNDTFIQKTGVNQDFGDFDDPDAFYAARGTNVSGARGWLFRHLVRRLMNRNVATIRAARSRGPTPVPRTQTRRMPAGCAPPAACRGEAE